MASKNMINECAASFNSINHLRDKVTSVKKEIVAVVSTCQPGRPTLADPWQYRQPDTWPIYPFFLLLEKWSGARLADLPAGSLILFCLRDTPRLQWLTKLLFFCSQNSLSTMPSTEEVSKIQVFQPSGPPAVPAWCMHKVYLLIYVVRGSLKQQCYLEKWSTKWSANQGLRGMEQKKGSVVAFPRGNNKKWEGVRRKKS